MATLQSITTGDFTSSTTWGLVQATTFVDSIRTTAFTITTTQTNATTAFTPGAITISGISLNIQGRTATPSGTLTVRLWNNTAGSIVKDVVVNISDLPSTGGVSTAHIGWVYFKFDTNVTLLAATAYTIRVFTSVLSQVTIYTSSLTTAANLSKALITTTNQAPAASDILLTSGTYTTATGPVTNTVTMNNTAATVFGLISIAANGVITYGTASSTNYLLTLAGNLFIGAGGTLSIGTVTSPIPATSTATLQLTCTTALQYIIGINGNMTTYGASKTIATKLAVDVIVGATTSTTSTSTGWNNSDVIVVPSTTRTYTQYESKTLNSTASSTTLTHNAYTNAHGGNSVTKVQADIVNLTRNVVIRSTTGTLLTNKTNIQIFGYSVTSFYYTAFIALGTGIAITNSGICVNTLTTGTFNFQYNSIYEIVTQSATTTANTALQTDNTGNNTTISNNIFYLLGWGTGVPSTIISSINNNNYFIGCLASGQIINANYAGSGNVFTSNNTPATINAFYNNSSDCSFYSNNSTALSMTIATSTNVNNNLSNFRFWRNNTNGLGIVGTVGYNRSNLLSFTGSYFFGNTGVSITIPSNLKVKIYFSNSYFFGGTTLVQPNHFTNIITNFAYDSFYYDMCYFGYSDSSLTSSPFSGAVITIPTSSTYKVFSNCYFNSTEATVTSGYPYTNLYGGYRSLNHDGVTGSNIEWAPNGTITTDTTYYLSSSKSTRLTPNTATYKLTSPIVRIPVKSGNTCNISVNVRKSTTLDGVIYNGNQPRLMYAFNPLLGNITETIGDTTKNIFQYPQNFDNTYWQKAGSSITPDSLSVAAPDGTFTADLFIEDNTTNRHRVLLASSRTVSIGTTYNLSLYAKKATHDWIQLNPVYDTFFGINNWANFNLSTGEIGNTGVGASASIKSVGNDWYRLSLQCGVIASGITFLNLFTSTNNTNSGRYPSYTGTNAQCFYIWGAQLTEGSTLEPYYDNGSWENISYTTATFSSDGVAEFYVDCDGTTGWINIDDWNTTTANDSRGQDYWGVNGVYIEPTYRNPTRSSGYTN